MELLFKTSLNTAVSYSFSLMRMKHSAARHKHGRPAESLEATGCSSTAQLILDLMTFMYQSNKLNRKQFMSPKAFYQIDAALCNCLFHKMKSAKA